MFYWCWNGSIIPEKIENSRRYFLPDPPSRCRRAGIYGAAYEEGARLKAK